MSLYKREGSDVWWLNIRHAGHRVRRSTGHTDRSEAQKVHNEVQMKLWQAVPVADGYTWGQAVMDWVKVEERSESELLSLRKFATKFPDRALSAVTPEAVDKALAFCKTAATYTRYRTMLMAILNLAKKKKHLLEVPELHQRKDKKKKPRIWITVEQWERLHDELPPHLQAMAAFALATGLRQANVLGLTWDRVDIERKLVWVEAEDTKADAALAIPLSDWAVKVLKAQQAKPPYRPNRGLGAPITSSYVFTFRGKPVGDVKTAFIAACVRAKLGEYVDSKYVGFTWHGLRHTWATWHIQNGTPVEVLKDLGGWSDLRMVMNYAHHTPGHLASFANNSGKKT